MNVLVAVLVGSAVLLWPRRAAVAGGRAVLTASSHRQGPGLLGGPGVRGRFARRADEDPARVALGILDALGPSLAAGLPPAAALAALNDAGSSARPPTWSHALQTLERAAAHGSPLGELWSDLGQRTGAPELDVLARSWTISEQLGAPLADAATTAAGILRARLDQQRRLATATAGARATMALLTALPLGGIAVAALLGISPWRLYAGSPLSLASLVSGAVLLMIGRRWARRMVRRATRGGMP